MATKKAIKVPSTKKVVKGKGTAKGSGAKGGKVCK